MSVADKGGARTTADFIIVPGKVLRDPIIGPAAKLLYGRLKLYAGKDGKAYPKHETLASEICLADRQVRYLLMELRAAGWINWTRTRTSCVYVVHPDRQKSADQARQDIADLSAEKCRSRSAVKCRQNRSIENHHQKRRIEKKNPPRSKIGKGAATAKENPKPKPLSADDENLSPPMAYATPEAELQDIYRQKSGNEISPDVERRIWETVELRGVPRKQFMDELRKHLPNTWKNPAGFLTNFARKIGSIATPEQQQEPEPEPPKNEKGRCADCNGTGYRHWDGDLASRVYCDCQMGRELKRVDARMVAAVPPAVEVVA